MSTKARIIHALKQNELLSGEQLAKQLNISRNAIWKAIHSLSNEGFIIESTKQGYQLHQTPQTLHQTMIESAFLDDAVFVYDSIDSTNTQAKLQADTLRSRGIFVSKQQTAGRGRNGRSFYSPMDSGLYISVLYPAKHLQQQLQLVTPLAAVAMSNAIKTQLSIDVDIKWVNDLFLNNKKVAGILTEAIYSVEDGVLDYLIIGMGLNVKEPEVIPEELKHIVGYLTNQTVDMNALAIAIIQNVFDLLDKLPDTTFMASYKKQSFILGKTITVHYPTHTIEAKAKDITDDGHLVILLTDGSTQTLQHGEVSIRL